MQRSSAMSYKGADCHPQYLHNRWHNPVHLRSAQVSNYIQSQRLLLQHSRVALLDTVTVQPSSEDKLHACEELADTSGAFRCVSVQSTRLGRGLVLKQPVSKQMIVSVPLHNALVISDDPMKSISVFGDQQQEDWQDRHGQLPEELLDFIRGDARWDVRMTAWLLWLRQHHSKLWQQYLALLPTEDECSCLLNYSPQEATELQLQALQEEAKVQHEWVAYLHSKFFAAGSGLLGKLRLASTPQDTFWANSLVRSRTFSENLHGEGLTMMVPFCDMANHAFANNSTFCLSRDTQRFELRSLQPTDAGVEATISYGEPKPNLELMRDYGFCIPGNPHDRLTLPEQAQLPRLNGALLLQAAGFEGDWRNNTLRAASSISTADTLDLMHVTISRRRSAILSLPLSDGFPEAKQSSSLFGWPSAQAWTDSGRPPPQMLQRSQVHAEKEAVQHLMGLYRSQLHSLPTSMTTDQELLQLDEGMLRQRLGVYAGQPVSSARLQQAIRMRLEYKQQLQEAIHLLEAHGKLLQAMSA